MTTRIDRPVFVVGMPRSGSTAFHDVIATQPEVGTTTRVTRKAPTCLPALKLLGAMARRHTPGEAGSMWDRFLTGDSDVMVASDVTEASRRYYTRAVANVLALYGKSRFVAKCPRLGLRMGFLLEIFPDARFIHLIRDGRAVARSLLEQRDQAGDRRMWWDIKPEGWRQWEPLDPVEAVAHQWDDVVQAVSAYGAGLPPEQYLDVKYEDFTADPVALMSRVAKFCELTWEEADIREATRTIQSRNDKWAKVFTQDEVTAMMAIMGPTMARYGYR